MKAFCTYCSAQKDTTLKMIPAIKRYKSQRIISVYSESLRQKHEFIILSGKFGLLYPNDEVPFYDHLLKHSEVEELAQIVDRQIKLMGLSEIVFFTRSPIQDKNVVCYIDCLEMACEITNTILKIRNCSDLHPI